MNPVMDQERTEFLTARLNGAPKQLLPQWVRPEKELPVVSVPIDWVRFSTLNHRTRAEQMRESEKRGVAGLFREDPLGEAAQQAQFDILATQDGFEDLKGDLRDRGQQEPAVVTAEGVLINGNRRAAALRDLWRNERMQSARYIRAYVLPADATADELIDLETELQVAKDYREDYSWVNEALLIEEIFEASNKNWDNVGQRMRLKPPEARAQYEKLQQLHQLVSMSNGTRHHADFVDNESAFDELSKHIKDKPPEESASVRSVYFLGTLSGVRYRDLRHLRRPDASALVRAELARDPSLASLLVMVNNTEGDPADDLLDDVLGGSASELADDLTPVLSFLAQCEPDEVIDLPDGVNVAIDDLLATVRGAVNAAANEAKEEAKDAKAVEAPIFRLLEAREDIERAAAALARARTQSGWSESYFEKIVGEVKAAIEKIETL